VNNHDIENVLSLYDNNAILLPTLSNKIRKSKAELRDYFEHFLAKKDLKAEVKELYIQSIFNNQIRADSGTYVFSWKNAENETEHLNARFTFIIHQEKILEHHSSIEPIE
jgi:hypothetical protein